MSDEVQRRLREATEQASNEIRELRVQLVECGGRRAHLEWLLFVIARDWVGEMGDTQDNSTPHDILERVKEALGMDKRQPFDHTAVERLRPTQRTP